MLSEGLFVLGSILGGSVAQEEFTIEKGEPGEVLHLMVGLMMNGLGFVPREMEEILLT